MAAHLVLIACLAAEPHTCQEIPLLEVTFEDVVSCTALSKAKSDEWQKQHDDYLVIAVKCVKSDEGGASPPAGQSN